MSVLLSFDEAMHQIYINCGQLIYVQQLPQIEYSSLITAVLEFIISFLMISETEFPNNKNIKNKKEDLIFISDVFENKIYAYFVFAF